MKEREIKVCKKCGRQLPEGYKSNLCESCKNKRVDVAKKIGGVVVTVAAAVITGGKFKGNKK